MRTARKARAHVEYTIELASSWVLKSVYGIEQYTEVLNSFNQCSGQKLRALVYNTATDIRAL